ncbi:MAG: SDR family NAD(P)-dependent oxidoreductase [Bacteroidota bacterium]
MGFSNHLKQKLLNKYGSWALVTGASSGIGMALSKRLAEAGFNLVLHGRNATALAELSSGLEDTWSVATDVIISDISSTSSVVGLIESLGDLPIGLFIASAGFGTSGDFIDSDLDEEIKMLQVNNLALMMLTHHFSRVFAQKGGGGIILMSSIVGFQGVPKASHYAATKAYVQSLGEGLHHELKPHQVDVLAAAPGPVASGFGKIADMQMTSALTPEDVALPILKSLGKKSTVFPGRLTQILIFGLRTVPRWGKIRIMKMVMGGMTKHQKAIA